MTITNEIDKKNNRKKNTVTILNYILSQEKQFNLTKKKEEYVSRCKDDIL